MKSDDATPPSRRARLWRALDERAGLGAARDAFLGQRVDGAPSIGRSLGAALVALFLFACATGVALAFSYSPSTTSAWASVAHIETRVPLGGALRALHYHATSALFLVALFHLAHVVATAAYRRPREAGWVLGLSAILLLPLFAMTGNLLPMDQDGYWGAQVELAVVAAAPAGDAVKSLLIGGDDIGNATLTRFYALHALVLPVAFLALLALRRGVARRRRPAGETTPYFPRQATRDALVSAGVILATIALAAIAGGARLDAPADPASNHQASPEWYFMALNQLNTLGGTALALVAPLLAVGLLFALPLVDRPRGGAAPPRPRPSPVVLGAVSLLALGFVALTARGLLDAPTDPDALAAVEANDRAAADALAAFERGGVDSAGRLPLLAGERLYRDKGCASCHDDADVPAPRLAGWATLERTSAFLAAPDDARFFANTPFEGQMDAFAGDEQARDALSRYLLADSDVGIEATAEQLAAGRAAFEDQGCANCHNDPTVSAGSSDYDLTASGPDLAGYAGREWTRALLRDASHPTYFGGAIADPEAEGLMPAYPDLTDDDLALLVRWLVAGAPGAR